MPSKIETAPVGGPKAATPAIETVAVVGAPTTVGSGAIDSRISVGVAETSTSDPPVMSRNGAQLKHSTAAWPLRKLNGTVATDPSRGPTGRQANCRRACPGDEVVGQLGIGGPIQPENVEFAGV